MERRLDLLVIGGGSAGLSAARFGAKLGLQVTIVEAGRLGGDCTWTGCVPSKALLYVARRAHEMRTAGDVGLTPCEPEVDLQRVMEHVRGAQRQLYDLESPEALALDGVTVIDGNARFTAPDTVAVGAEVYRAKRILIATGAQPFVPPVPGLAGTPFHTYETIWDLPALPARLLVVGAGPIGCELAQAFQRLGSAVTILDMAPSLLPLEDADASELLRQQFQAEGIAMHLGQPLSSAAHQAGEFIATVGDTIHRGDALLMAVGRRPRLEGLGVEAAGIQVEKGAIVVDAALRTSQPHILAAGDCTGGFQFTHYASWQGVMAVRNAFLPGTSSGIRHDVPRATFTDPEVAQVGLGESAARERFGQRVRVAQWPLEHTDRAVTDGGRKGFVRVVTQPNGLIAGAVIVGPHASEQIHEWVLAIDLKLRLQDLSSMVHVYPTYAFAHWQLAGAERTSSLMSGLGGRVVRWLAGRVK